MVRAEGMMMMLLGSMLMSMFINRRRWLGLRDWLDGFLWFSGQGLSFYNVLGFIVLGWE